MKNFFNFIAIHIKKYYIPIITFLILLGFIAVFDKALAVGLILLGFLMFFTFFVLSKLGLKSKTLFLLLLITLIIHLGVVLFIYYADFQPFSGGVGDYRSYHKIAVEISQRIRQGNFSLGELGISHYYPVIMGYIYTLTLPEMLIGQLFGVWLAVLGVLFTYLIVIELGSSKKWAFLIGLIVNIYPSYLFYGSLLLKDTLIVPLVLAGLLFTLKLIKNFSWRNFLIFYIILGAIIHFRFYIGYALLFTFILCWLLLCKLNLKKKFIYGIIIIILLGFLPQFSGYGYCGRKTFKAYLNPETITVYREVVYTPPSAEAPPTGLGSSFEMDVGFSSPLKFLKNSLKSFSYTLLGPFPWQIRYRRQLFALFETIPWYFLFFILVLGMLKSIKTKGILKTIKHYQFAIPLLVFAVLSLGALSLFVTNFGIITRIRIPAFISLLCLIPLGFEKLKYINKSGLIY